MMTFLILRDIKSGATHDFEMPRIHIGRDPTLEMVPTGAGIEVVSARHAVIFHEDGKWWIEDLGSSNGTFVDDRRLGTGDRRPLKQGSVLGLGSRGPRYRIEETAPPRVRQTVIEQTIPEEPVVTVKMRAAAPDQPPSQPASNDEAAKFKLLLRELQTGQEFKVSGTRIRIGRGAECDVRLVREEDTIVSRSHSEIVLANDQRAVLHDLRSRNGTFVNGQRLLGTHDLERGDRIELGQGGPVLVVEVLVLPQPASAVDLRRTAPSGQLAVPSRPVARRRSFGGKGRTAFVRDMIADSHKRQTDKIRWAVWSATAIMAVGVGVLYWYLENQARATEQALARTSAAIERQRVASDSLRQAARDQMESLRLALEDARASSAPADVVDSLRRALDSARARTASLAESLRRAQVEVANQLAQAESTLAVREQDAVRLAAELRQATSSQVSGEQLDSLRRAVANAQRQAASLNDQLRAVRGVNLAAVAEANQSAVGLVWAYTNDELVFGSGFVISRTGYFVTNRHVVDYTGQRADSLFITMADQQQRIPAEIVRAADPEGPDLALLRMPDYTGPVVSGVDWDGTRAVQGEPAAIIGFPAGLPAAVDRSRTVRTSMNAGIFSKITPELIQFDGFTITGSSGSPIFNANGEVVAVHRAGLEEAVGLAFAVPISLLMPLIPPDTRADFGIP